MYRRIRTFTATFLFCAVSFTTLPTHANEESEHLRLAREYVNMSVNEQMLDDMAVVGANQLLEAIKKKQPDLYAQKSEKLRLIIKRHFRSTLTIAMADFDLVMAETFTVDELRALMEFYSSDVGKSIMKKMPKSFEAVGPKVQESIRLSMPVLIEKLKEEGIK